MAISSRALDGEIPLPRKVQRLSRKGVGPSGPKRSLSGNGEDDIVSASGKPEDVPVDHRLNCIGVANQCEQKHGQMIRENPN